MLGGGVCCVECGVDEAERGLDCALGWDDREEGEDGGCCDRDGGGCWACGAAGGACVGGVCAEDWDLGGPAFSTRGGGVGVEVVWDDGSAMGGILSSSGW